MEKIHWRATLRRRPPFLKNKQGSTFLESASRKSRVSAIEKLKRFLGSFKNDSGFDAEGKMILSQLEIHVQTGSLTLNFKSRREMLDEKKPCMAIQHTALVIGQ